MELGQTWAFEYMGFMSLEDMFSLDGWTAYVDYLDNFHLKLGHRSKDRYMQLWAMRGTGLPSLGECGCEEVPVSEGLDWMLRSSALRSSIDRWRYSLFPRDKYALEVLTFFADRGAAREALMLAALYHCGYALVEKDPKKADHWYIKAKENAFSDIPELCVPPVSEEYMIEQETRDRMLHMKGRNMMAFLMKNDYPKTDIDRATAEYMIQQSRKDPYLYSNFPSSDDDMNGKKRGYAERLFNCKSKEQLLSETADSLAYFIDESNSYRADNEQCMAYMLRRPEIVVDRNSFRRAKLSSSVSAMNLSAGYAEKYFGRGNHYYGAFEVSFALKNTSKVLEHRLDEVTIEVFDGEDLIGTYKERVFMISTHHKFVEVLVDAYGAAYHVSKINISVKNILMQEYEEPSRKEKEIIKKYWDKYWEGAMITYPVSDVAEYAHNSWIHENDPEPSDQ